MKCTKRIAVSTLVIVTVSVSIAACIFFLPYGKKVQNEEYFPKKICESGDCFTAYDIIKKPVREVCEGKECLNDEGAKTSAYTQEVCTTQECVIAASEVLKWIDKHADPCTDFYNFSCGNFALTQSIPENKKSYSISEKAEYRVDLKVKNILEEKPKTEDSDTLKKLRKLYGSCVNTSHIEDNFLSDLKEVLSDKGIGDWPFLKPDWKDCRLDLEWRMAKLNVLGIDSLFKLEVKFKGAQDRAYLYLDSAPSIASACYCSDNITAALKMPIEEREILISVLKLLDVEMNNITEEDIDDLFTFDYLLCNISNNAESFLEEDEEPTATSQNLQALIDIAPEINWIRWRNIIFSELHLNFPHDKLHIYLSEGFNSTIENIMELIHNTSSRVLANYLTWKFVFNHLGFLGQHFRQIMENYRTVFESEGVTMTSERSTPRWQQCVKFIYDALPYAVLPQYLPKILTPDMLREMAYVSSAIKNEFRDIFQKSTILLRDEKVKSIHRIDQLNIELFFPDREKQFFEKYYKEMGKLTDSFLKNGMKALMIRLRKMIEGVFFMKTFHDLEYLGLFDNMFSSGAMSLEKANKIVINLGQLEETIVTSKLPRFMSMGTIGCVIGHEMGHIFDLSATAPFLTMKNSNWTVWPDYVTKHAESKAKCLSNQYAKHRNINDVSPYMGFYGTIDDDISDNQGMLLAFKAYKKYLSSYSQEKYLPGLPYTNEQLFFILYGQTWCMKGDQPTMTHSPNNLRVNLVLQNFQPFSKVFKCAFDSPMNPRKKCESVWA